MSDERKEAQASLYALDALTGEELREFETALRSDLELQLLGAEPPVLSSPRSPASPRPRRSREKSWPPLMIVSAPPPPSSWLTPRPRRAG